MLLIIVVEMSEKFVEVCSIVEGRFKVEEGSWIEKWVEIKKGTSVVRGFTVHCSLCGPQKLLLQLPCAVVLSPSPSPSPSPS